MVRILFFHIFVACLAFTHSRVAAQEFTVDVQHIDVKDGLLHREVRAIFEDSNGLIWFGGLKGLQRYDGHQFKAWTKADRTGFLYYITSIAQDDSGWLWLWNNDRQHFVFLHPETEEILTEEERFGKDFPIYKRKGDNGSWVSAGNIPTIEGKLHFGTADGKVISYDQHNGFQTIQIGKGISAKIELATDESFWLQSYFFEEAAQQKTGLYKVDLQGNILAVLPIEPGYLYTNFSQVDDKLYLQRQWRGSENVKIKNFVIDTSDQLVALESELAAAKSIKAMGSEIWITDKFGNWNIYDNDFSTKLFELKKEEYSPYLFSTFNQQFRDSRGIHWIYRDMGIFKITTYPVRFQKYFSFASDQKKPFYNEARGIWVTQDSIFVNFERSGTVCLNKQDPNNWTILSDESWARPLLRNATGNFKIGYPFSIKVINSSGIEIEKFLPLPDQKFNGLWSLYEDINERLWIGTGENLYYKDKNKKTIHLYQPSEDLYDFTARRGAIQNMIPAKDGNVWFCSWTGLYLFDPLEEKILARYASDEKGANYLPADLFYYLHEDKEGIKWIGTADGLIRWEGPGGNHKLFNRTEGLSDDVIYALFEDDYNRLWMSSDYGIMSFDKESYSVKAYSTQDGISHHEFNRTSQFQHEDGTIYFGGLNGITSFHPKNFIEKDKDFAKMQITEFEIFDGEAEKLVNRVGDVRMNKSIVFKPKDRFFRLKFVLPTFADPTQILYAWKIEGVDKDWNYQKENTLQIGALPYGRHQLHVKGQSGGGGWSPHELNIEVDVRKPFYLQFWFILLILFSVLAGIAAFFKVRTRVLKREITKATNQIEKDKYTIEQQAEELKKLDKLKSRFFANVSHELRTPLALMIGPINQLIKKNGHDPKDRKLLEFIQRNSLHLKKLVTEILDLSKLENNKLELKEEPVDFYPYFHNHIIQFYSIGSSENITFAVNFRSDKELSILLDKNKFEKIINNYLSNAIKFTAPGGEVNVDIFESATEITFEVRDNGRGIHPDDLPYVFDRFYQSNQADAPTEGGTGIGLSFSRELAQLMGGKVWAESTFTEGSQFYFQLPLKKVALIERVAAPIPIDNNPPEPAAEPAESTIESSPVISENIKILIAEDNRDLREYYKIILADFKVVLTENGQAALDYLEGNNDLPDLIISDLMMPVMDGFQFLEKIKSTDLWRGIPVIMLTAKTNRQVKLKALRIGIDDYITKPFDDEELLVRIENLLNHYSSRISYFNEEQTKLPVANESKNERLNTITKEEIQWLEELEEYVINNIEDELLSVELLSHKFTMSKSTLLRQLRKTTGLTPSKYIQEHRLNIARQLIENREYKTVAQVAMKVGFKNANAFSRSFKNRFGNTPTEMMAG